MLPLYAGIAVAAALGWVSRRPLSALLVKSGAVRPNYAGKQVPVAMGLLFVVAATGGLAFQTVLSAFGRWYWPSMRVEDLPSIQVTLITVAYFGLLGLVDDILGSRESRGFAGHFRTLLRKGELTTGALKALAGGLGAVVLAFTHAAGLVDAILGTLIIALTANLINLLDLRPGRALKVFFVLFVAALCGSAWSRWGLAFLPLAAAALVYAPMDLGAQGMMGDAGSNVLGASLGTIVALSWSFWPKVGWLAVLVAVHLYAEHYSISETIERVAVLRTLDRLGRGNEERPAKEG